MRKYLKILIAASSVAFIINSSHSYAEEQTVDLENISIEYTDSSSDKLTESKIEVEDKLFLKDSINSLEPVSEEISEVDKSDEIKEENQVKKSEEVREQITDLEEIYYYRKVDLDKNYIGYSTENSEIGKEVIELKENSDKSYKDKWVKIGDQIHYIDSNGKRVKGFYNIGEDTYYFGEQGLLRNDKIAKDSGIYDVDNTGKLSFISKPKAGWLDLNNKTYYYSTRGELLRGLQEINNNRYIFNNLTGQVEKNKISKMGNQEYYSTDNGVARRIGWDYYNGNYAYVNSDGSYSKGLTSVSNRHYFFSQDGNMMTDTNQKVNGQWWYFDFHGEGKKTNGKFRKGWYGDYYYFSDGKKAQGYQKINGKLYYFDDRYYNKRKNFYGAFDFKAYYFDKNGVGKFIGNISKKRHQSGTDGFKPGQTRNAGRLTPYYNQRDGRWAWKKFANTGSNFADMGCGSTTMAMALSRVKKDSGIYPTTVAKDAWYYTNSDGTEWEFVADEAIRYGLKAYRVPINRIALVQALGEGPVVIRVGPGYFTNSGHFMVLDSYNNGYFYLNDPYFWNTTIQKHSFGRLKASTTTAWLIK